MKSNIVQISEIVPAKTKRLRPMQDYLQIESIEPNKVGEIYLPEKQGVMTYVEARVIECGPDCKVVKQGDVIMFAVGAMLTIPQMLSRPIRMTKEDKILCVVEEEKEISP